MGYVIRPVINGAQQRWQQGIIPYTFTNRTTQNLRTLVVACMRRWELFLNTNQRIYCQFFPRTNQTKYIEIDETNNGPTTSDCLGQPQGRNVARFKINTSRAGLHPDDEKDIPHELGHVMGLIHEHQRARLIDNAEATDAPSARLVYQGNVLRTAPAAFAAWDASYQVHGNYDLRSLMHYPNAPGFRWSYAPYRTHPGTVATALGSPTRVQVLNGTWSPSAGDIAAIRSMY